jgi:hypothetical protein
VSASYALLPVPETDEEADAWFTYDPLQYTKHRALPALAKAVMPANDHPLLGQGGEDKKG